MVHKIKVPKEIYNKISQEVVDKYDTVDRLVAKQLGVKIREDKLDKRKAIITYSILESLEVIGIDTDNIEIEQY